MLKDKTFIEHDFVTYEEFDMNKIKVLIGFEIVYLVIFWLLVHKNKPL